MFATKKIKQRSDLAILVVEHLGYLYHTREKGSERIVKNIRNYHEK